MARRDEPARHPQWLRPRRSHKALAEHHLVRSSDQPGRRPRGQANRRSSLVTRWQEAHCIGWLNNQLGVGNNIVLRLQMGSCENARAIRLRGEQHETFEETLP